MTRLAIACAGLGVSMALAARDWFSLTAFALGGCIVLALAIWRRRAA